MKKRRKRNKQRRPNDKKVVYPVVTHEQLEDARQRLQGEGCILCGEPATHISFFRVRPEMEKIFGVPPDTIREFAYTICRNCVHSKDRLKRVEDVILDSEMADVPRV